MDFDKIDMDVALYQGKYKGDKPHLVVRGWLGVHCSNCGAKLLCQGSVDFNKPLYGLDSDRCYKCGIKFEY